MPTISYSIGGEKHDISGKSGEEVVKMVEAEYAKQKKIKFKVKKVEEEEEVDAHGQSWKYIKETEALCPDCYTTVWNRWEKGFKYRKLGADGYIEEDEIEEEIIDYDINHPLHKDKTNYHEYTREECEYHNIDYDELHAEDYNYCEKCGRPSEVWGGNPHKGMCKKCSISEGWAKWCDKHDKISYKTETGEGCRDCKKEEKEAIEAAKGLDTDEIEHSLVMGIPTITELDVKILTAELDRRKEEDKSEYWYANGGTMTFINATEAEMEEIDADEWGSLYDFNDERK